MGPFTPVGRLSLDPVVLVETFLPRKLIQRLSTLFGLWTAVSPLLLWIAWPPRIWFSLLVSGLAAMMLTGIFTAALMPPSSTLRKLSAEARARETGPWARKDEDAGWRDVEDSEQDRSDRR